MRYQYANSTRSLEIVLIKLKENRISIDASQIPELLLLIIAVMLNM